MYDNDHLSYMRARYYDPTIGRFLSEDPVWSTNLYPYVRNNPISFIDPAGNKEKSPEWITFTSNVLKNIGTSFLTEPLPPGLGEFMGILLDENFDDAYFSAFSLGMSLTIEKIIIAELNNEIFISNEIRSALFEKRDKGDIYGFYETLTSDPQLIRFISVKKKKSIWSYFKRKKKSSRR